MSLINRCRISCSSYQLHDGSWIVWSHHSRFQRRDLLKRLAQRILEPRSLLLKRFVLRSDTCRLRLSARTLLRSYAHRRDDRADYLGTLLLFPLFLRRFPPRPSPADGRRAGGGLDDNLLAGWCAAVVAVDGDGWADALARRSRLEHHLAICADTQQRPSALADTQVQGSKCRAAATEPGSAHKCTTRQLQQPVISDVSVARTVTSAWPGLDKRLLAHRRRSAQTWSRSDTPLR